MLRLNYLSLLIMSLLICSGCTFAGAPSAGSPYAVNCDNCNSQPYYSLMIVQPGISSDFPVSYRVRVPENDSKLSKISPTDTVNSRAVAQ